MFAFTHTIEGLLFIHCILLLGFVVGSLVLPWRAEPNSAPAAAHLARTVVTITVGAAVLGFTLLTLGMTSLLTPLGMALALALLIAVSLIVRGRAVLAPQFWNSRIRTFIAAWDMPAALIYLGMLGLSVPAVIPTLGSDPAFYHLAYAVDWAQAHSITIDPFLRFPFYANNFVLFFAAMIAFNMTELLSFLTWGTSLLTALGILAAIRIAYTRTDRNSIVAFIACALTAAIILNPTYLRWNDSAYIDIPLGCFMLMTLLSLQLAIRTREAVWLISGALIGAFLVGMKPSLILVVPLIMLEITVAARFMGLCRKTLLSTLALFLVFSSPWYLRNFIFTGDPIPPALGLALHDDDIFITSFEWTQLQSDFHMAPATATAVLTLPFRAFAYTSPQSLEFREYGTTLLILFLYVPCLWLLLLAAACLHDGEAWLYALAVTWLTVYWIGISTLLRYGLLLMPTLAVAIGILAVHLAHRLPMKAAWGVSVLCLFLIVPSPGSQQAFRDFFLAHTRDMLTSYTWDSKAYLLKFGIDYSVEQRVAEEWRKRGLHGNVYALISQEGFYYRLDGIRNVGDWIGPGGYFRFNRAIALGCATDFLTRLNADGVVILPEGKLPPYAYAMLVEQLNDAKYETVPIQGDTHFFIRPARDVSVPRKRECDKDPNWFIPS